MSVVHFGKVIRGFKSISSTQDEARRHAEAVGIATAGTILMTSDQTAGRGRQGRVWYAPPGSNLSQTMIGAPVPLSELWQLPFVVGVALHDALIQIAPDAEIRLRFPNDVHITGKKVAGILIETAAGLDVPSGMTLPLIGVGVNVCGDTRAFPPEVAVRATTLEAATGQIVRVNTVGNSLCRALNIRWTEWQETDGFPKILALWKERWDMDARRVFSLEGEMISCYVRDVTVDGNVRIELPDGSSRTIPVPQIVLG